MLVLLAVPARADWISEELEAALDTEAVEETAQDAGLDFRAVSQSGAGEAFVKLLREALSACLPKAALSRTAGCLMVVLVCGLLRNSFGINGGKLDVLSLCGAAGITTLTMGGTGTFVQLSIETLQKAQDAANALLPTLSAAALISGEVNASAAKYAAAAFFLNVLQNLCIGGVIPAVQFYCAAAAAEAVCSEVMSGVMRFLKWCVTTVLIVILLCFTVYLSVSGLISGTTDAAILRGAKTTISTMLPLVGSIASDAAASVLSAAAVLRQKLGIFGLLLIAAVLLLPFLRIGAQYLLMKGAAAVSGGLGDSKLQKLMERNTEALGMLLACLGACGLMLFFSVFSLLKVSIR